VATYRGFDVLELDPDRGTGLGEDFERKVFVLDNVTGRRAADAPDLSSASVKEFAWLTYTRAEAKVLREFIDARAGRAVPCWVPAWEEDMTLTADVAPGGLALTVLEMGYAVRVFPVGNGRRHLANRIPGGAFYFRKVTGAADNGNGTETVTIEEGVPVTIPTNALIGFLHFARLDDDVAEIEWAGQFAECRFRLRDLPAETPA